ncbi:MAG: hypothetical protein KJ066_18705 [Acidobacteria bacterium]|nr:hypothetical protein [Acidobacteriota bacterium]
MGWRSGVEGRSVVELLVVLCIAGLTVTPAVNGLRPAGDHRRAEAAARALAATMRDLRIEAVRRGASVALDFTGEVGDVTFRCLVDGNGNGVRRADVEAGTDHESCRSRRLADDFAGVTFGTRALVVDVDGLTTIAPNERAIRFGASRLWSASPAGTTSSGTAYLSGPPNHHYAVRTLGATGRVRVLRYDATRRRWDAL